MELSADRQTDRQTDEHTKAKNITPFDDVIKLKLLKMKPNSIKSSQKGLISVRECSAMRVINA